MRHSDPPASRSAVGKDRRSQHRYPVELELHCKPVDCEAIWRGKTTNISSNGVRFHVQRAFPIGEAVELRVKWPTLLPETRPLELVLEGRVIHSDERATAVQILRYAFGKRKMTTIREPRTGRADASVA